MKKKLAIVIIAALVLSLCSCMPEAFDTATYHIPSWLLGDWKSYGEVSLVVEKDGIYHYGQNYMNKSLYDKCTDSEYMDGSTKVYHVSTSYKGEPMIDLLFRLDTIGKLNLVTKTSGLRYEYSFTR